MRFLKDYNNIYFRHVLLSEKAMSLCCNFVFILGSEQVRFHRN